MSKIVSSISYLNGALTDDVHFHNEYEILFVVDGKIEVCIDNKSFIVEKNQIVFITNLEKHFIKQLSPTYKRYRLCLKTLATDTHMQNSNLLSIIKNHLSVYTQRIDATPFLDSAVRIFKNINIYKDYPDFSDELVISCITELLALVYVHNSQTLSFINDTSNNKILEIQRYIDKHYSENILINELSKKFYISSCYLSHKFKDITGLSPKQYLSLTRLKNASLLLINTNLSISEISSKVGFNDVNNFIKKFKEAYGVLPNHYRHGK